EWSHVAGGWINFKCCMLDAVRELLMLRHSTPAILCPHSNEDWARELRKNFASIGTVQQRLNLAFEDNGIHSANHLSQWFPQFCTCRVRRAHHWRQPLICQCGHSLLLREV